MKRMKKIGIIGCGWLGLHLAQHLSRQYKIYGTTTSEEKCLQVAKLGFESEVHAFSDVEIKRDVKPWEILQDLDTVIITIPFPKNAEFEKLRIRFENVIQFIKNFDKPIFLMSSIGIYPQIDEEMNETNVLEEYLNQTILGIENLMEKEFPQINILRLAGLMGDSRVFSNYKISNTEQIVNHIHYEDICLIIENMISRKMISKTYNVVAPQHPTKQEIIDFQINKKDSNHITDQDKGRKIVSSTLETELDYQFLHPDPKKFK